jgi:hypothetical protein
MPQRGFGHQGLRTHGRSPGDRVAVAAASPDAVVQLVVGIAQLAGVNAQGDGRQCDEQEEEDHQ